MCVVGVGGGVQEVKSDAHHCVSGAAFGRGEEKIAAQPLLERMPSARLAVPSGTDLTLSRAVSQLV